MLPQILSGVILSFSLVPKTMLIPIVRDEKGIEAPYIDLIFWFHERGVDLLFIAFYYHLLRKVYLYVMYLEQETTWGSGSILFILF